MMSKKASEYQQLETTDQTRRKHRVTTTQAPSVHPAHIPAAVYTLSGQLTGFQGYGVG